jgi:hypothetical protein
MGQHEDKVNEKSVYKETVKKFHKGRMGKVVAL